MTAFAAYSMSFLEEKDAPALAALESVCFSLPWSEEQYRVFLRHGRKDAEQRQAALQEQGSVAPAGTRIATEAGRNPVDAFTACDLSSATSADNISQADRDRSSLCDAHGNSLVPFVCWGIAPVLGVRDTSGALAAYVSLGLHYTADEMEIYNIASAPQARRQGLAARLLGFALREAGRAGMARAVLEVRTGNTPALALYERLGFFLCGRRKRYYTDSGEDALVLECRLPLRALQL